MRNFVRNSVLIVISTLWGIAAVPAAAQPGTSSGVSAAQVVGGNSSPDDDSRTVDVAHMKAFPHCQEAKAGGPEKVVRAIFDQFEWGGNESIEDQPRKVLAQYFVPNLVELLLKHQKCNFYKDKCATIAPIWNQNSMETPEVTEFQVCAMDTRTNYVRVQFRDSGGGPVILLYKLARVGVDWKIADVMYVADFNAADPGASHGPSLMDTLSDSYAPKH